MIGLVAESAVHTNMGDGRREIEVLLIGIGGWFAHSLVDWVLSLHKQPRSHKLTSVSYDGLPLGLLMTITMTHSCLTVTIHQ